jgi:hypothetical protein
MRWPEKCESSLFPEIEANNNQDGRPRPAETIKVCGKSARKLRHSQLPDILALEDSHPHIKKEPGDD